MFALKKEKKVFLVVFVSKQVAKMICWNECEGFSDHISNSRQIFFYWEIYI